MPDSEKRCQYATILGIKLASGCRAPGCGVPPLRLSSAAHVGLARWGAGAGERCHPPTPHLKSPGSPDGAGGGIEPASRRWRKVCGSEVRRKPWVVGTPETLRAVDGHGLDHCGGQQSVASPLRGVPRVGGQPSDPTPISAPKLGSRLPVWQGGAPRENPATREGVILLRLWSRFFSCDQSRVLVGPYPAMVGPVTT